MTRLASYVRKIPWKFFRHRIVDRRTTAHRLLSPWAVGVFRGIRGMRPVSWQRPGAGPPWGERARRSASPPGSAAYLPPRWLVPVSPHRWRRASGPAPRSRLRPVSVPRRNRPRRRRQPSQPRLLSRERRPHPGKDRRRHPPARNTSPQGCPSMLPCPMKGRFEGVESAPARGVGRPAHSRNRPVTARHTAPMMGRRPRGASRGRSSPPIPLPTTPKFGGSSDKSFLGPMGTTRYQSRSSEDSPGRRKSRSRLARSRK